MTIKYYYRLVLHNRTDHNVVQNFSFAIRIIHERIPIPYFPFHAFYNIQYVTYVYAYL